MIQNRLFIHFSAALLLFLFTATRFSPIQAAGVVGTGSPASCTEAALNTALTGGGTITFNCGGAHTITFTSTKTITADTTLDGGGVITLSGGDSTRLFSIQGADVTLRHITLSNGRSPNDGGAIYAERLSSLTLENSTFTNNTGLNGGAIATNGWGAHDDGVVLTITNSTFSHNTATATAIPGGGNGGGAIYLSGGSAATITNSTFSHNQSQNGGAIHLLHSNLHTVAVTFTQNSATNTAGGGGGGAIYMDGTKDLSGLLLIEQSTFTENQTNQLGGAIFSFITANGRTEINDSTFTNNLSTNRGQGGAIYHQSNLGTAPLDIANSTFNGNIARATPADSAGQGGALWLINSPVTIINSTFANNRAEHAQALPADDWRRGFGGAIRTGDNLTLINSTLAHNSAGFVGGALAGAATVRNSIIAHNTADNPWDIQQNCTNSVTNGGHNLQYPQRTTHLGNDYECFVGQTAVNPQLGALGNYGGFTPTIPLMAGSPAINAAANCPSTDQRGFARNGACDIGAFEFNGGIALSSLSPASAGLNNIQSFTLTVHGAGFGPSSVVRWNGSNRPTTYISPYLVTAVIPATDVDETGVFPITVHDPDRSLTSNALTFTVYANLYTAYLPTALR
jgi:predicted outer membrane repeat protein